MRSVRLVLLTALCVCFVEISTAEVSSRWQTPVSYTAGQTASLTLTLSFGTGSGNELEPGTRIYIDTPNSLAWPLQSISQQRPNYVYVTKGADEVKAVAVRRDAVSGLPPGMPLLNMVEIDESGSSGGNLTIEYRNVTLPRTVQTMRFPLFYSSPSRSMQTVSVAGIRTSAGIAEKVLVSAPSIVRLDSPFDLLLQVTDANNNLVSTGSPSFEVIVDGVFARRVAAGRSAMVNVPGMSITTAGLHSIELRSGGGGLVGTSNLILAGNSQDTIVWADTHSHSMRGDRLSGALPTAADRSIVIHDKNSAETAHDPTEDLRQQTDTAAVGYVSGSELRRTLASGGNQILVDYRGEHIQMALADTPADYRRLDPRLPILAEIVNGRSQFEWFGNRLARFGYRVGFVATGTSHLPGEATGPGRTAIWVQPGQTWLDALAAGATYAVSSGKPILKARLNGALPGSRITDSSVREQTGEVHAPFTLARVDLMKNGVVVDQRFPGEVVDSDRVKVTLTSPSAPLSQWMMPRPGREWIGYLKIGGATVSTIEAEHFQDDDRNNIAVNPTDPGRVDFIAWTHGSAISFVVTSKVVDTSASEDVTLELHIMAGSTTSGGTPAIRQFSSLDQLRDGAMKRSFEASGHTDLVELTLLNRSPVSSYGFSFRDMTTPRAGDYYYVRVHGAEDQLVWSSPVFAGGFDVTSD